MASASSPDPDELERVDKLLVEVAEYEKGGKVLNDHYDEASYIRRRRGFLSRCPAFAASATTSDPASRDGRDVFANQLPQLSVQKVRQREIVCEVEPLTPFPTTKNTQTIDNFASYPPHEWEIGMPEMWPVPIQPDNSEDEGQIDEIPTSATQQASIEASDSNTTDPQQEVGVTSESKTYEEAQKTTPGLDVPTSITEVTTTIESDSIRVGSSAPSMRTTQSFTPSPEQLDFMLRRLEAIGNGSEPPPLSTSARTATSASPPMSSSEHVNIESFVSKPRETEAGKTPSGTHHPHPPKDLQSRSMRSSTAVPLANTTASALANRPAYVPVKPQMDRRKRKREEATEKPQDDDGGADDASGNHEARSGTRATTGAGSRGKQRANTPATKRVKRTGAVKSEAAKPTRRVALKAPRRGRGAQIPEQQTERIDSPISQQPASDHPSFAGKRLPSSQNVGAGKSLPSTMASMTRGTKRGRGATEDDGDDGSEDNVVHDLEASAGIHETGGRTVKKLKITLAPAKTASRRGGRQPSKHTLYLERVVAGECLPRNAADARTCQQRRQKLLQAQLQQAQTTSTNTSLSSQTRTRGNARCTDAQVHDAMPEFFAKENFTAAEQAGGGAVRCACGVTSADDHLDPAYHQLASPTNPDAGSDGNDVARRRAGRAIWVGCDMPECSVWQHARCMGDAVPWRVQDVEVHPQRGYKCHVCDPWAHRKLLKGLRVQRTLPA